MGKKYLSFKDARDFVHTLSLTKESEWYDYSKSGKKPDNIPSSPRYTYKSEFISMGDWLGIHLK